MFYYKEKLETLETRPPLIRTIEGPRDCPSPGTLDLMHLKSMEE